MAYGSPRTSYFVSADHPVCPIFIPLLMASEFEKPNVFEQGQTVKLIWTRPDD